MAYLTLNLKNELIKVLLRTLSFANRLLALLSFNRLEPPSRKSL